MSVGTGRSLGAQFSLGWDQFYAYYEQRPLAFVVILAFVAMAALDWSRASTPRPPAVRRVCSAGSRARGSSSC